MLGLLILVLVAMRQAALPDTWSWMFPQESSPQAIPAAAAAASNTGVPVSLARSRSVDATDAEPARDSGVDGASSNEQPGEAATAPAASETTANTTAAISPELWGLVVDRQVGLLSTEAPVLDALLEFAHAIDLEAVLRASPEAPPMAALQREPERYRGELLLLRGTLRRLGRCTDTLSSAPQGELFDGWLFTDEAGEAPYRVIVIEVPPDLPLGESLAAPVVTAGRFFKLQGYVAPSGVRTTPVLIARTFRRLPGEGAYPWAGPGRMVGLAAVGVVLSLLTVFTVLARWRWGAPLSPVREFRRRTAPAPPTAPPTAEEWAAIAAQSPDPPAAVGTPEPEDPRES